MCIAKIIFYSSNETTKHTDTNLQIVIYSA